MRSLAQDVTDALVDYSVKAYRAAAFTLGDGKQMIFDTDSVAPDSWDPMGWYDTATGLFTPKIPGRYEFNTQIGSGAITADNYACLRVYKNPTIVGGNVTGGTQLLESPHIFQRGTFPLVVSGTVTAFANGVSDSFCITSSFSLVTSPACSVGLASTFFEARLVGRALPTV